MQLLRISQKDAAQRLDKYLKKALPAAGGGFLYKMLRKKNITVNGKKAEGSELLSEGDEIRLYFSDETYAKLRGGEREDAAYKRAESAFSMEIAPRLVYEDEDLIFLDKPAGLLSQSDKGKEYSANDWLLGYCLKQGLCLQTFRPTICNRLDRNTSGILLCAKSYAGARFLSEMIRAHQIRKYYHAVVEGELPESGVLVGTWKKDTESNRAEIVMGYVPELGSYVETRYRILDARDAYTLAEVELVTGRSHQIRAHFAAMGHPLAGDIKYGGHPYHGRRTQLLRAQRVTFMDAHGAFARMGGQSFFVEGLSLV